MVCNVAALACSHIGGMVEFGRGCHHASQRADPFAPLTAFWQIEAVTGTGKGAEEAGKAYKK